MRIEDRRLRIEDRGMMETEAGSRKKAVSDQLGKESSMPEGNEDKYLR